TGSDGSGADKFQLRRFASNAVIKKEPHALFNPDASSANASIANDLRDAQVRTLVLLPGTDVFAELDQLARTFFFKLGTHPGQLAALRDYHSEHAFACAPTHAGEIEHARAGLEVNRVDFLLDHQAPGFCDSSLTFVIADRHNPVCHAAQTLNQIGHVLSLWNRFKVIRAGEG